MTQADKDRKRIIEITESRGDFITAEDGFVYFWPTGSKHGFIAAHQLRWLADELDRRNKAWEQQINSYFDSNVKDEPRRPQGGVGSGSLLGSSSSEDFGKASLQIRDDKPNENAGNKTEYPWEDPVRFLTSMGGIF